jgi:GT2 family glycosyltransferase
VINNKETVCVVLVTFNRKKLLLECLEAIKKQTRPVDAIYIIDNTSQDGTPELLKSEGFIPTLPPSDLKEPYEIEYQVSNLIDGNLIRIYYVRMHENTGGAGGFSEGIKRAYGKNYDWLWLMDDDVEPVKNGLEKQISYSYISKCIHPSKKYINGNEFHWNALISERTGYIIANSWKFNNNIEWRDVNVGCFEGMLIHRTVVENIGFPDKKLFFVGDDTIYGYKIAKFTRNIHVKDIIFIKKLDNKPSKVFTYLLFRNYYVYIARMIAHNQLLWMIMLVFHTIKFIVKTMIKKNKGYNLNLIFPAFKGLLDGIFGIWGKEKDYLIKI